MKIIEKLNQATIGDDDQGVWGDVLPSAGINLSDHGNAIIIYAVKIEEAQALRDEILKRILGVAAA